MNEWKRAGLPQGGQSGRWGLGGKVKGARTEGAASGRADAEAEEAAGPPAVPGASVPEAGTGRRPGDTERP